MLDEDTLSGIGKKPVVGIFGDYKFPMGKSRVFSERRKDFVKKFRTLILEMDPGRVLITPSNGLNASVLTMLKSLEIPYTLVLPYQGWCNTMLPLSKMQVYLTVEKANAIVTMQDSHPKDVVTHEALKRDAENFIIERSSTLISFFTQDASQEHKNLNERLEAVTDTTVLLIDYSN